MARCSPISHAAPCPFAGAVVELPHVQAPPGKVPEDHREAQGQSTSGTAEGRRLADEAAPAKRQGSAAGPRPGTAGVTKPKWFKM